ncbi:AbrB family transcriptional regulator [Segnochrobactraceae bacterium EtOH-i3]
MSFLSVAARRIARTAPPLQWLGLIVLAIAITALLDLARFPSSLLLGPLIAGVIFGVSGASIRVPKDGFLFAQGVAGCLIGHALTPSILTEITADWPVLIASLIATLSAAAIVGWGVGRTKALPADAAAWGAMPGMAGAMVALSQDYGADSRLVAFMQYVRLACVILTTAVIARFLFGVTPAGPAGEAVLIGDGRMLAATIAIALIAPFAGRLPWPPAGPMLVPLVIGAVLQGSGVLTLTLPHWLLGLAYALIGFQVGLRFTRGIILVVVRSIPAVMAGSFALILLCALSAVLLVLFLDVSPVTAFLATAPGSIESMALMAIDAKADVSFVLALQTLRLFAVVLAGPWLARSICRLAAERPAG